MATASNKEYAMRTCSTCKLEKHISEFHKKTKRLYRSDCKSCFCAKMRPRNQMYYQNNKPRFSARSKAQSHLLADFIRAVKEASPVCPDCKSAHPYHRLEFDHVVGQKSFDISSARRLKPSMARLLDEMKKCELVCANCHRDRTHARRQLKRAEHGGEGMG